MHYKDGTPAKIGDIIQHDAGHVGIVIGGMIGNDYCSTQVVAFRNPKAPNYSGIGKGYVGVLKDEKGEIVAHAAVEVGAESAMQTREMTKIGHVDIGHG